MELSREYNILLEVYYLYPKMLCINLFEADIIGFEWGNSVVYMKFSF